MPREAISKEKIDIEKELKARIFGQDEAIEKIVPFVDIALADLSPDDAPPGVFLLLGPTGTGKTQTVQAMGEILHGWEKAFVKINCGEFSLQHEVAKLVGAPPGYLGHRETQPMLTQAKLNSVTSEGCKFSILLLDEIEKAAPGLFQMLLGILDKGELILGDNTKVDFSKTFIFMTSNLGAGELQNLLKSSFGFNYGKEVEHDPVKAASIGLRAAKKKFTPEFMNRIDEVITYKPLGKEEIDRILGVQIRDLNGMLLERLEMDAYQVGFSPEAKDLLIKEGFSREYGGRELKRTFRRLVMVELARVRPKPGEMVLGKVGGEEKNRIVFEKIS